MYATKRTSKSQWVLTPEEQDVRLALRGFIVSDEPTIDFTPTRILYDTYCRFYVRQPEDTEAPAMLSNIQFGAALGRVYEALEDRERRTRRMYYGKQEWGYIGVRGPGSITVQELPGRMPRVGVEPT